MNDANPLRDRIVENQVRAHLRRTADAQPTDDEVYQDGRARFRREQSDYERNAEEECRRDLVGRPLSRIERVKAAIVTLILVGGAAWLAWSRWRR